MAPATGLAAGLNKGHVVTTRETKQRPSRRKGVSTSAPDRPHTLHLSLSRVRGGHSSLNGSIQFACWTEPRPVDFSLRTGRGRRRALRCLPRMLPHRLLRSSMRCLPRMLHRRMLHRMLHRQVLAPGSTSAPRRPP